MKKIILLVIFIVASFSGLSAQSTNSEVFPSQANTEHNEAVQKHSQRFVTTLFDNLPAFGSLESTLTGAGNSAQVIQIGERNIAEIDQNGIGNYAFVQLEGIDNRTGVQQDGNLNTALIYLLGDDNNLGLTQEGSFNSYFNFRQGNGLRDQVLQSGNNLMLEISGDGLPVSIEQYGNGNGNGAGVSVTTQRGYN